MFGYFLFLLQPIGYNAECLRETTEGPIVGVLEISSVNPTVKYCTFRGIPYAKPPIGHLRFREPHLPEPRLLKILDAKRNKPPCAQTQLFSSFSVIGSEDCLYLNIYVPKLILKTHKLPVMVWIYGGSFISGSNTEYEPDYFMEKPIVMVTIQYRVGILGFLNSLDSTIPGNLGLKDQIRALCWIRDNVEYFGGDNRRVTIFGSGSGGASVSLLLLSPLARGLFHGAISQSGSSLNPWALMDDPRSVYLQILQDLQIPEGFNAIRRLQTINVIDLIRIGSIRFGASFLLNGYSGFHPSVEVQGPGAFLTQRPYDILRSGNFNRVPYIAGYNNQDGDLIFTLMSRGLVPSNIFLNIPRLLIPSNIDHTRTAVDENTASVRIRNYYFSDNNLQSSRNIIAFVTDQAFVYGIKEAIKHYSEFVPSTFSYKILFTGIINTNTFGGVSNGQEVHMFWLTNFHALGGGNRGNFLPTPREITIRRRMVMMWTNFATFRNPTPVGDTLFQNVVWPTVRSGQSNPTLLVTENLRIEENVDEDRLLFWESIANRNLPPVLGPPVVLSAYQPPLSNPTSPIVALSRPLGIPGIPGNPQPASPGFPQGCILPPLSQFPQPIPQFPSPQFPGLPQIPQNISPGLGFPPGPQFNVPAGSPQAGIPQIPPGLLQTPGSIPGFPQGTQGFQTPFSQLPQGSPQLPLPQGSLPQPPGTPQQTALPNAQVPFPPSSIPPAGISFLPSGQLPIPQAGSPQNPGAGLPPPGSTGQVPAQQSGQRPPTPQVTSFPQSPLPQSGIPGTGQQGPFPPGGLPPPPPPQAPVGQVPVRPPSTVPQPGVPSTGQVPAGQQSFPPGSSLPQMAFPQSPFPQLPPPISQPQSPFGQTPLTIPVNSSPSFPQSPFPQPFPQPGQTPLGQFPLTQLPQGPTFPQPPGVPGGIPPQTPLFQQPVGVPGNLGSSLPPGQTFSGLPGQTFSGIPGQTISGIPGQFPAIGSNPLGGQLPLPQGPAGLFPGGTFPAQLGNPLSPVRPPGTISGAPGNFIPGAGLGQTLGPVGQFPGLSNNLPPNVLSQFCPAQYPGQQPQPPNLPQIPNIGFPLG